MRAEDFYLALLRTNNDSCDPQQRPEHEDSRREQKLQALHRSLLELARDCHTLVDYMPFLSSQLSSSDGFHCVATPICRRRIA